MREVSFIATGVGSSPWNMPNYYANPFNLVIQTTVTGTISYTIDTTMSNYALPPVDASPVVVVALPAGAITASTVLTSPVAGWRVTIISGAGSVAVKAMQAGNR